MSAQIVPEHSADVIIWNATSETVTGRGLPIELALSVATVTQALAGLTALGVMRYRRTLGVTSRYIPIWKFYPIGVNL